MTRATGIRKVILVSVTAVSSTLLMVPAMAGQLLASLTPGPTEPTVLLADADKSDIDASKKPTTEGSKTEDSESWRSKPPTYPTPRPFKLPKVETYYLDNGLKVQLAEDHRFPYLTSYLGFKSGSVHEPKEKLGLSDLTADMVTEGTTTLSSKEIAAEADFIGGNVKAIGDYDFTIVSGACLSNYTDRLFKLMTDVVLHPSFPESELKLKKTNLIQELAMRRSQPHFLLEERFRKVVFGGHPYAVVAPEPEMVTAMSRDDLV
ncbi:MAG: insulinase family protein, partial [Cyanobacteria bacterium]|nr:insulinase family protein [Cyanobacteriota bacterium]